jgi:hypothetical protein
MGGPLGQVRLLKGGGGGGLASYDTRFSFLTPFVRISAANFGPMPGRAEKKSLSNVDFGSASWPLAIAIGGPPALTFEKFGLNLLPGFQKDISV